MRKFLVTLVVLGTVSLVMPMSLYAQGSTFIVCNTTLNATGQFTDPCNFNSLVTLAQHIINYMIVLATVLVAISACWAGFLMLSSGGDEGNVKKAKEILRKTVIGFFWVLGAWVIVNTIVTAFLGTGYTLLGS